MSVLAPDPQHTVLVWGVRNSPVVVDGETPYSVSKVIISAPNGLYALRSRETRCGEKLAPLSARQVAKAVRKAGHLSNKLCVYTVG